MSEEIKQQFVKMTKDGETIEVHPDTIREHQRVDWSIEISKDTIETILAELDKTKEQLKRAQKELKEITDKYMDELSYRD